MRARCLARELTGQQRNATSAPPLVRPRYQITEGRDYLVLGIVFVINSNVYGNNCLFEIQNDAGKCLSIPSLLFEITDWRASKFWRAKVHDPMLQNDFVLTLWPEEFYHDFFHDRAFEGEPEELAELRDVVERLEKEFTAGS